MKTIKTPLETQFHAGIAVVAALGLPEDCVSLRVRHDLVTVNLCSVSVSCSDAHVRKLTQRVLGEPDYVHPRRVHDGMCYADLEWRPRENVRVVWGYTPWKTVGELTQDDLLKLVTT